MYVISGVIKKRPTNGSVFNKLAISKEIFENDKFEEFKCLIKL